MEKQKQDKVFVDKSSFERLEKGSAVCVATSCGCMCIGCMSILSAASEMAVDEIKALSKKLETEQALRREAEHIAHQVSIAFNPSSFLPLTINCLAHDRGQCIEETKCYSLVIVSRATAIGRGFG